MIRTSHAYLCTYLPSDLAMTSCDLYVSNYAFVICYMIYTCLSCLAWSNGAILSVTGEYLDAIAPNAEEEQETPQ